MRNPKMNRRTFGLGALAALAGAVTARAASGAGPKTRYVFVHAVGGWDPLVAFAPLFDNPLIEMGEGDEPTTIGDFSLVDGPDRPSVASFFQQHGGETLLVNGLSTRSVNHFAAQAMALTGSLGDSGTDWATLLALAAADDYYLPHVTLDAPIYPGTHSVIVGHANGLLRQTVDGSVGTLFDAPVAATSRAARDRVGAYLASRTERFAGARALPLVADQSEATARAEGLASMKDALSIQPASTFAEKLGNAVSLLASGVTRCVSVATHERPAWDTHDQNVNQRLLFEELFGGLLALRQRLGETSDDKGSPLAASTVIVVVSEMGRTPILNDAAGRDHWPFTSALVVGPGVRGGRAIGGYTDRYVGVGVDEATGDLDPKKVGVDPKAFGATLLALGGADPAELIPGAAPIQGALS